MPQVFGNNGWDDGRRSRPRNGRHFSSRVEVDDDLEWDDDLRRARSQGNGPMPNINIFNRMDQEDNNNNHSPPGQNQERYSMPGGWAAGGVPFGIPVGGLPVGALPARARSRSRGDMDADELDRRRRDWSRQRRDEEEDRKKREEEAIKNFRSGEEDRARRERQLLHDLHVKDEERRAHEAKLVEQAKLAEEAKKRAEKDRNDAAIRAADEAKRKAADDRKALLHQAELERAEEEKRKKDERERVKREIHEEEIAKKEKEKAEMEEYERKIAARNAKEKEEKDKKQQEYLDKVQHDFQRFGFTNSQIKEMVNYDEEKARQQQHQQLAVGNTLGRSRSRSLLGGNARPIYPKIHRQDIALETLRYFELDWEYDSHNRDYIIIMHELTVEETDELFAHTRHLKRRSTPKLLEDKRGRENEFMWIKKRDKSRGKSRDRSRGVRVGFAESIVRHL